SCLQICRHMKPEYRIGVVLDETFGDKLLELSQTMHVWVCDSEPNRRAAERIWAEETPDKAWLESGGTSVQYDPNDIARSLFDVIRLVEEHHGEYAHDPPWTTLEVFGASPNRNLIDALQDLGVRRVETTETGLIAFRGSDDAI